ncbi:hypothetical protein Acr_25g0010450 [Actinidia rufa]|uniref:Uncharacterized protein n=1 Tax=Actinidia rufa TaxID=165716 RepID=A0A7J0H0P7_9ERIC|nr:hypothetical protein Acr_25g0010450 [Actinidia rufa]
MDSSETTVKKKEKSHRHQSSCLRCSFAFLVYLLVFLSISFLLGFVVVFVESSSISNPISVSSQCKIVSSRKKFRCRHDYYWASVFEVEYKYHSGETRLALAEAPNEALPVDCRPNFGVAWLTKDKFKVNETYDCWYTFGFSKVNIYHNSYFNCQAKDPSTIEMLRRFFILSPRILESWFARNGRAWFKKWEAIAGVITGFSTSLISITLIRVLQQLKSSLPPIYGVRMLSSLKRACLFVAYFSFVGWLVIQYGKKLGLPEIFRVH